MNVLDVNLRIQGDRDQMSRISMFEDDVIDKKVNERKKEVSHKVDKEVDRAKNQQYFKIQQSALDDK